MFCFLVKFWTNERPGTDLVISGPKRIGAIIRIGREIQCLPYAGLFFIEIYLKLGTLYIVLFSATSSLSLNIVTVNGAL